MRFGQPVAVLALGAPSHWRRYPFGRPLLWSPRVSQIPAALGAASHTVTGLTLSPNQAAYANRRLAEAGVADRAAVLIGSIVHMRERAEIVERVAAAVRPGGRLVVSETYSPGRQPEWLASRPARFVLRETFGFTHVTTLSEELAAMEDAGLEVLRVENSTDHYLRTLEEWLRRLRAARAQVEAVRPGAYRSLRAYLEMGRVSPKRHSTLQFEIVAVRPPAG